MAKDSKDKKAAPKGGESKGKAAAKKDYYSVEGGKLERQRRSCPKCGPGVFLSEHKDRSSCGKCSYTEFKKKE